MTDIWRSLKEDIKEPKMHFAVEETLLRRVDEGRSPNTLRLRRVDPSVFIGIYQDADEEVDLEFCDKNDIPVIRRPNPGGAVYQDEGTFCYSLFFRKKPLFSKLNIENPSEMYELLGEVVIKTLKEYDVKAEISGANDVTVNGKKIYGSAQIEWYSGMVHSGTFLIDVDKDALNDTLNPKKLKFEDKEENDIMHRVVNLSELVDDTVKVDDVMEHLKSNISSGLNIEFQEGVLSADERKEAEQLYEDKYSLDKWTYQEHESRSMTVSTKGKSGVIVLSADTEGDVFKNVSIRGDFLVADQKELDRVRRALSNTTYSSCVKIIENCSLEDHLKEDLKNLIDKAVERYE